MTWELVVETKSKEHTLSLETNDETVAEQALDEARQKMANAGKTVTIASRLVVRPDEISSVRLQKSFGHKV